MTSNKFLVFFSYTGCSIKKAASKKVRGSELKSVDTPLLLFVGLQGFWAGIQIRDYQRFAIPMETLRVSSLEMGEFQKSSETMLSPAVVVLGLAANVTRVLFSIRRAWPYASVIIAADESRLPEVYPLLASGASDYVSLSASNAVVEERCLLQFGVYLARLRDSSRSFGKLTVNFAQRTVTNGKDTAHLTPIEVNIVRTLVDSFGGVVPRERMKQLCWGDAEITDNALNRKIYEVRRTLRQLSENINIRTIYGMGFELQVR